MQPVGRPADEPGGLAELQATVRELCASVQPGLTMEDPHLSLEEIFSAYELALVETRTSPESRRVAEVALDRLREALRRATNTTAGKLAQFA
jgi:hypothetical protein